MKTARFIGVCFNSVFCVVIFEIPWRRKWQPTPESLPGKSYGQRSLVGCSPWGLKELGMTERLTLNTKRPPRMATLSLLLQVLL